MNESQLIKMWENRAPPVRYTSPYREIPLDCSGEVNVTRILAGAYSPMSEDEAPYIKIGKNSCSLSIEPYTGHVNVYECVFDSSPIEVGDGDSLYIYQRDTSFQIVFLYDGKKDFPLISINISK